MLRKLRWNRSAGSREQRHSTDSNGSNGHGAPASGHANTDRFSQVSQRHKEVFGLLYFDYKFEIEILQAQMDSFVAAFAPSLRGRSAGEPTRATVHRNPIGASVLSEGKYF